MIEPYKYYFEEPLYKEFEYGEEDLESLYRLIYFSGKIDCYCPYCEKDSIFKANPRYPESNKPPEYSYSDNTLSTFSKFKEEKEIRHFKDSEFIISFKCERSDHEAHILKFHTKSISKDYTKHYIHKIGQFPSLADLKDYNTKPYSKVLSKEKYHELNKAIGLASHGVGIGSFVYLRRIFEHLIFESYNANKESIDNQIKEGKFQYKKMDVKIDLLKPFLPNFLIKHKDLYGIMSLGVHQLNEKKCLEMFGTIELGIKLILEEKVEEYKKKKLVEEFTKDKNEIKNTPPNTA